MPNWQLPKWLSRRASPESKASDALARFLAAGDLDDLLRIASELPALDVNDATVVGEVISEWRAHQAVANLLFHPTAIPVEVRTAALLRGLGEDARPYLKLAAIVGLQSTQPSAIAPDDVTLVRERLLQIIAADESVISSRASVTIDSWLDSSSAAQVCRLLDHPNQTVAHNLLAWLIRHVDPAELTGLLNSSDIEPERLRHAIRDLDEYKRSCQAGESFTPVSSYLFTYIPNLSEFTSVQENGTSEPLGL